MIEKISLNNLTQNGVFLVKTTYTDVNGQSTAISQIRNGYDNSILGRQSAQENIPEPYLTAVMAVWGDTPTVEYNTP